MNKQLLLSFILPLIIAAAAIQNVAAQTIPVPTQQADGTWSFTMPDYDVAIEAELVDITINPLSVTEFKYDGTEKKPEVTAKAGTGSSTINIEASKCKAVYPDDVINAGTKNITEVKVWNNGGGEANVSASLSYQITPIVIDPTDPNTASLLTITISPDPCIYKGIELKPTVSIVYNGIEIPSTEYTVTYQNNNNVGTAIVIITDNPNGNYTINATKEFSILPDKIYITAANTDADGTIIADASNKNFCEGKAVVDFTVDNGAPKNYEIEFDGGTIPAQNGALNGSSISISLPKNLAPGVYKGTLVLTGDNGVKTDPMPLKVDVKLPYYTIVTLYNDVAAVNQLAGDFSAYKWTENGSEISGANGRILQHTFNKSSVYAAILTKTDGGSYETCPLDLSRISVGNSTARLVVYPNPAIQGNDITVEVSENYNPEANKQIYIYKLNGTLAKHLSSPQEINKVQLPTGNYSGVYIQNGEKVPFKLIVK
ncbi:MAG: hypothetical protein J5882_08630 [Bacteroidales bacterium]|nr:hypothetical protein [Bacteroidales bacterium]